MTVIFSVGKNALLPSDQRATALLATLQIGELLDVDVLRERESAFRRFVFAAINRVAKAADIEPQQLRVQFMVESGRYHHVTMPTGATLLVVASMKRQAMDDKELREFWVDARELITAMLPRFSRKDREEIDTMLKGGRPDADAA